MSAHFAAWEVVAIDLEDAGQRTHTSGELTYPWPEDLLEQWGYRLERDTGMENRLRGAPQTRGTGKDNYSPVCARNLMSPHQFSLLQFPFSAVDSWVPCKTMTVRPVTCPDFVALWLM